MKMVTERSAREALAPKNLTEWNEIKERLIKNLEFATSIKLLKHDAPLNPVIEPSQEIDDIVIEKFVIQTLPGFYVAGNIYRPKDTTKKYPTIINPHGHYKEGRISMAPHGMLPVRFANYAKRGFVAIAYDMIGYNDTVQLPHHRGYTGENTEYYPELEYNISRFGLQLNNSIKVVDFTVSLPYVDTDRIGCTGCSGGGTQTYFLTAYDQRIKAAAPINMAGFFYQGGCMCENPPFLRIDTNSIDYTMMTAPRPLFMASSDGDWTFRSEEFEFPAVRSIYSLYGAEDKFETYFRKDHHGYQKSVREKSYIFFCKVFGVDNPYDGEIDFDIDIEKLVFGGIPDFEGKLKTQDEVMDSIKKLMLDNLKKLSDEEKEDLVSRIFALDKDFYFDIPYKYQPLSAENPWVVVNQEIEDFYWNISDEREIKLGKCPEKYDDMGFFCYHSYNYAYDTKRVNCLIKLLKENKDAHIFASGKTAALVEIADRFVKHQNLNLTDPDYSDICIPGIKLIMNL